MRHYDSAILIRNHDHFYKNGIYSHTIKFTESPVETIDITNIVIKRKCHFTDFVVLDNSRESILVDKKVILDFMQRETCLEALMLAHNVFESLLKSRTDVVEIPENILNRLKEERPQFYSDLKKGLL